MLVSLDDNDKAPFAFNGTIGTTAVAYPSDAVWTLSRIVKLRDSMSRPAIRRMGRIARSRSENNFIVSLVPHQTRNPP